MPKTETHSVKAPNVIDDDIPDALYFSRMRK